MVDDICLLILSCCVLLYCVQCRISVGRWTQLSHFLPAVFCCRCCRISWLSSWYGRHIVSYM